MIFDQKAMEGAPPAHRLFNKKEGQGMKRSAAQNGLTHATSYLGPDEILPWQDGYFKKSTTDLSGPK